MPADLQVILRNHSYEAYLKVKAMIERAVSKVQQALSEDSNYDISNWTIDDRAHN